MDIQHTKKKTEKSFATFLFVFFFFFFKNLLLTGKMCWWMKLSCNVSCWQLWRPAGPIHLQRAICWDQSLRCPRRLSTLKESQACAGTGKSAALQMNQCFRAQSCHCNTGFLITLNVWIRLPLIISDVDYNRPVSGFACLSIEETDCNMSCFIKEYEVIWHEATACRLLHCEMIIGSTVAFAFVMSALRLF